ncbi:MAG: L,D-transpeptidase [Solirubrobacteraceae bacterium]
MGDNRTEMTTGNQPTPPQDSPARTGARRRALLAALAALVALIPIAVGIVLTSSGSTAPPPKAAAAPLHLAPANPPVAPARPSLLVPPGHGALVATVLHATVLRVHPKGRILARLPAKTEWGSPEVLWVRRLVGRWLGVVSTKVGNNRLGWLPASDASLARVDWQLRVSLAAHRLTVLENGRVRERYTIAIGAPASPTPTGNFDVTDRLVTGDNSGPYGCCILALSAVAPHAIADWTGGNRIAIHSTPETWTVGLPVSHGCMRLTLPEGRWLIDHIPLGTPTIISSA